MANSRRNEVQIELAGKTWTMRPTFAALCDIEDRTGRTIVELGAHIVAGQVRARDFATIVHAGIAAAHEDVPGVEEIGEAILAEGNQDLHAAVVQFMESVLQFHGESKKKTAGNGKAKTAKT